MEGHDEIIHQQLRLKIMATLNGLPAPGYIEFPRLRAILEATDGNLGAHLNILEGAGYVQVEKDFVQKKPRTRIRISRLGKAAFDAHIHYLRAIVEGAQIKPGS
ncbi:MAG: transcriptional regulator [Burkholderiaceae bacterium]